MNDYSEVSQRWIWRCKCNLLLTLLCDLTFAGKVCMKVELLENEISSSMIA